MNSVQVMDFLVTNSVAIPVVIILIPVLLFRAYPSVLWGKSYVTILMREIAIPDGGIDTWQP